MIHILIVIIFIVVVVIAVSIIIIVVVLPSLLLLSCCHSVMFIVWFTMSPVEDRYLYRVCMAFAIIVDVVFVLLSVWFTFILVCTTGS